MPVDGLLCVWVQVCGDGVHGEDVGYDGHDHLGHNDPDWFVGEKVHKIDRNPENFNEKFGPFVVMDLT